MIRLASLAKVALATACCSIGSVPAAAQLAPGHSGFSTENRIAGEAAWRELASFGKCYAARNKDRALKLIATEPGSRAEIDTYKAMFRSQNQSCLGSVTQMNFPYSMVRGAIAEGLYKQRVALPANAALAPFGKDEAIVTLTGSARCFVSAHTEEVRALIATTWPGSKEEAVAVRRLVPHLSKCIPANAQLNLDTTQMRFRFAEALYRMNTPQVSQVAGAN